MTANNILRNGEGNLILWEHLGTTSPTYTKPITGKGFAGTSINPTYCYKKLTEALGPCGIGWRYEVVDQKTFDGPDGQLLLNIGVALYLGDGDGSWSRPIFGYGGEFIIQKNKNGLRMDDEAFKKALTDALTNAMKMIGMSADIHMGMYDDNKYVNKLKQEEAAENATEIEAQKKQTILEAYEKALGECETAEAVTDFFKRNKEKIEKSPYKDEIKAISNARMGQITNKQEK